MVIIQKEELSHPIYFELILIAAKDILKNMCSEVAKLENTEKEVEAQKLICQAAHMAYEVQCQISYCTNTLI